MKNGTTIRRPGLANSNTNRKGGDNESIGDVMRKAKQDLFFRRCLLGILLVLLVSAIAYAIIAGYAEGVIDWFYSLVG